MSDDEEGREDRDTCELCGRRVPSETMALVSNYDGTADWFACWWCREALADKHEMRAEGRVALDRDATPKED